MTEQAQEKRYDLYIVLLCTLLCGLLYSGGQAVWDDHELLRYLQNTSMTDLLFSPVGLGEIGKGYYRPLSMFVLKMGQEPFGIHLISLTLHLMSTFIVYHLSKKNWMMALLFGLHPLCSEILGWSSAIPDALSTFLSASLLVAVRNNKPVWIFSCSFLALLSKENSLVMIALILVFYQNRKILFSSLILYVSFRFLIIGSTGVPFDWSRASLGITGVVWLWGASIVPFTLTAVRDVWHASMLEIIIGCVVPIVVLSILIKGDKIVRLGALLWILSPLIAFPTIASSHLAGERYMYLGLFGMALALSSFRIKSRSAWGIGLLFLLVSIPKHYKQAGAWKNDINLFTAATTALPDSSYSHHFLGFVYLNNKDYSQASVAFEKGLSLEHSYATERLLLLQSLILSEDLKRALQVAEEGPKNNLTAEYLAWWGRAAYEDKQEQLAWQLWTPLFGKDENGNIQILDGPTWFRDYIQALK